MSFLQTPVSYAHQLWALWLKKGDKVVDATCGHGHDTLFLAQHVLGENCGLVAAFDIQPEAIKNTQSRLREYLEPALLSRVSFYEDCHSQIDQYGLNEIDLIVYNLGYLPSSDKTLTTQRKTTLESLNKALKLLKVGGILSITCYPGHSEGAQEALEVSQWAKNLSREYTSCEHKWTNRSPSAPFILWVEKRESL